MTTPSKSSPSSAPRPRRITTSDALPTFQIALGVYTATPGELERADADGDTRVTTADALCIFQEALGIPNPCFEFNS